MRRRGFIGLGLCVAAGMSACTGDAFYRRVETLSDDQWVRGKACTFEVEAVDTVTRYDVYVDLRTSDGYPWREIYLIGQVCDTAQSVLQCDTLRCELFDAKGEATGHGLSNVKENGEWVRKPCFVREEVMPFGHGEKSVYIAGSFIKLKREEAMAINWHMGGFDFRTKGGDSSISEAYCKFPLAVMLHVSDLQATYIDEKRGA